MFVCWLSSTKRQTWLAIIILSASATVVGRAFSAAGKETKHTKTGLSNFAVVSTGLEGVIAGVLFVCFLFICFYFSFHVIVVF